MSAPARSAPPREVLRNEKACPACKGVLPVGTDLDSLEYDPETREWRHRVCPKPHPTARPAPGPLTPPEDAGVPAFTPANQLPPSSPVPPSAPSPAGPVGVAVPSPRTEVVSPGGRSHLILPEVDLAHAAELWNTYLAFRDMILGDAACYDIIEGGKEMNRTGATRLATAFGLTIEQKQVEELKVYDESAGTWDYRFRILVRVGKGDRWADGIGSCRLSEIAEKTREKGKPGDKDYRPAKDVPLGQREHFSLTKAYTRAAKRAIADLLGGTEAD